MRVYTIEVHGKIPPLNYPDSCSYEKINLSSMSLPERLELRNEIRKRLENSENVVVVSDSHAAAGLLFPDSELEKI